MILRIPWIPDALSAMFSIDTSSPPLLEPRCPLADNFNNAGREIMNIVRAFVVGILVVAALPVLGCNYGGASFAGDKVVVLRNDGFLMGMLRQAFVCSATDNGLQNCKSNQSP
jgi:hypothetical protein